MRIDESLQPSSISMKFSILLVVMLGLAGCLVIAFINQHGLGILPDSVIYADAAKSLAANEGYKSINFSTGDRQFLTHFPPVLSLLLLVGIRWGLTIEATALIINIISFLVLMGSVYYVAVRMTSNYRISFIACLFLFHPALLSTYTALGSEPPFIAMTTLGIIALWLYLENSNFLLLIACAGLIGVSAILRYAGMPFILAGVISIWLFSLHRLRDTMIFAIIASVPTLIWLAYSYANTGLVANRSFVLHVISLREIWEGVQTVGGWLIPGIVGFHTVFAALAAIVILIGYYKFLKENTRKELMRFILLIGCFQLTYIIFLLISISLFDALTPLNNRILSPIYPVSLISILLVMNHTIKEPNNWLKLLLVLYVVFILSFSVMYLVYEQADGNGYNSRVWKQSQPTASIQQIDPETVIYSNAPDALYWYTNRVAKSLPMRFQPNTSIMNPNFGQEVAEMREALASGAYLVYSHVVTWRNYLPTIEELQPLPESQIIEL